MAESPTDDTSLVLSIGIFAAGQAIDEAINVLSISVTHAVNKIPSARIEFVDGDMPGQDFPVSSSDDFKPGTEIQIDAGYGTSADTIFLGIVVRHGIKVTGANNSRLVIECRDKAAAMTIGRHNANYVDSTDSDIISTLISTYSGLSSEVKATTTVYGELVQYYCSDWDFMLSRAEVNGLLVCVDSGKLTVKPPQTDDSAELELTYGKDLMELHADIDARTQLSEVNTVSWSSDEQALVEESAGPQSLGLQGDLQSKDLSTVVNLKSFRLQSSSQLDKSALADWAKGQQVKASLARIRGRMKFQGSASAKPGTLIKLKGVGSRFNGNVFVSSVTHEFEPGNWFSEAEFGMSPDWFAEQRDLVAPPASGFVPGIEGLQIGVVLKLDEDPKQQNRIQVSVPILQADDEGVWARLANFYASNTFGAFFIPEIGDEVILGYLNNDPADPIVLGSLYSSKQAPPYKLSDDNFTKALVTKSKLTVEFDEDKKVITIKTPEGNQLVLSEDDESILIQDQNDNKVELSTTGIVLDSPKDISISAKGKISIDAMGEIAVSSKADVNVDGMNVNHTAKAGFTAKGNASAELSASGSTTVKGAMVMIN